MTSLENLVTKVTKASLCRQDNFAEYKILGQKITLRFNKVVKSLFLYLLDDKLSYTSCMTNFIVLNIEVIESYFLLKCSASQNDK